MTEQSPPAMDYAEHERTYEGFIKLTKIGSLSCLTVLLALAMYAFGGSMGNVFGTLALIGIVVAIVLGIYTKGDGTMPSVVVFGLSALATLVTTL